MGRWCRNVAHPGIEIDGRPYQLTANARGAHPHGGPAGFHLQPWSLRVEDNSGAADQRSSNWSPQTDIRDIQARSKRGWNTGST